MWDKIAKFTLAILLLASVFLRFYKLGSIPQGLNIDEASYGYDAYSLLKTGRDQWGATWPLTLKSFGDYKPSALSYAMIPFVHLNGLNTTSTRIPSALAGFFILPILFLTLQTLHKSTKTNLILTLIFSLSPWSYGISRLFYEPNIGLLFFSLGLLNLFRYTQDKTRKNIILTFIFLAISGYWYVAIRVTSALVAGLILILEKRYNQKITKNMLLATLTYFILVMPLIITTFSRDGLTRLRQESLGQDYGNSLFINENRSMCYLSSGKNVFLGKLCAIWWNKPVARLEHIGQSMLYQLSPNYLFLDQTQPDVLSKNTGPYIWVLIPLYFLGLYALLSMILNKKSNHRGQAVIALAVILLSNLPAAIAGSPMIHRNVIGIYMAFIIIAYGSWYLVDLVKSKFLKTIISISFLFVILFQTSQFLVFYFAVYTKQQPQLWRYDSQEIFNYAISQENNYDTIWFQGFEDAPLYYAFYSSMNPVTFQQSVVRQNTQADGWVHNDKIGKIKSTDMSVVELACQHELGGLTTSELVITPNRGNILNSSVFNTMEFTGVRVLHEAYSLESVIEELKKNNWNPQLDCR